jgi:hypothetical protein
VASLPDGDSFPDVIVQAFNFSGDDEGKTAVLHGIGGGAFETEVAFLNFSEYAVPADLTNDGLIDMALLLSDGGSTNEGSLVPRPRSS